ncbi:MAG: response regulator transcription factor [Bacteroidales bacterium]
MSKIADEYLKIYESFDYKYFDQKLIDKHINLVASFAEETQSIIAIYDNVSNVSVYSSSYYQHYFYNDWECVHPDDLDDVIRSSVIALRYFFKSPRQIVDHRLIRRYRVKIFEDYKVIIENVRPLAIDPDGHVWLSLVSIDIAPNQQVSNKVEFSIFNYKTGDIIKPVDNYFDGEPILSRRETEILRLIAEGLLSKEISEKLSISVNTVSKHRQRILEKLNVNSSIEAIKYANAMGVLV